MNGATALPLVRTMRPPNSASITRIGRSQNFFRTRINVQSSATNVIVPSSELVRHGLGRRAGWSSHDPVRRFRWIATDPQRILAEPPCKDAHRRDGSEE